MIQQTFRKSRRSKTDQHHYETTLYLSLPYNGKEAEVRVRRSKKRLPESFRNEKNFKFSIFFQYTKIFFFTPKKDRILQLGHSNVIYQ